MLHATSRVERETLLTDTSVVLLRPKEAVHHHHRRIVLRTRRPGGLVEMVGERKNFLRCSIISNSGSKDNFAGASESGRQSGRRHPQYCGVAFLIDGGVPHDAEALPTCIFPPGQFSG